MNMDHRKILSSKTIIVLVLLIILAFSIMGIVRSSKDISLFEIKKHVSLDSTVIIERIEKICELSAVKYYYSNVVAYKDNKKLKDFDLPFTQKAFLIKYDGYIKAGIHGGTIDVISNEDKSIKLVVEKSKILDHVIDEKSIIVYDEKSSIFNGLSINDVFSQIVSEKTNIENKLIEKGFLNEADNNLKIFLEEMLKELGYEKIDILFEAE